MRSILEIRGNAFFPGFQSYEVSYAGQANPDMWVRITHSTVPKANAVLAAWDTAQNPDGVYTVRLTAQDTAGRQRTQTVTVRHSEQPRCAKRRRGGKPALGRSFPFILLYYGGLSARPDGWIMVLNCLNRKSVSLHKNGSTYVLRQAGDSAPVSRKWGVFEG